MECFLLDHLFEKSVEKFPDLTAIEQGSNVYTYSQADALANRLACFLAEKGVAPEEKVVIFLPRCAEVYIAMLGILKTGGAYIPLDPEIPAERVNFIMKDSGARLIITADEILERVSSALDDFELFNIDHQLGELDEYPEIKPVVPGRSANDLCYIIYTSGTTGNPKGVLLEHRNVVNYVCNARTIYPIDHTYRALQGFSISFDASVEEIWVTLSVGAALVVGTYEIMRSGDQLSSILNHLRINFLSCAPTLLSMVKEDIPALKILIFGGEVCPTGLAHRWCKEGRLVYNTYGPTEAAVIATYNILDSQKTVTIGKALPGYRVLIVDENLNEVKSGDEGEILIGGDSIARGYLNQPGLTACKFIETDRYKGMPERYYRTGDLATSDSDGNIVFLGRADAQVKVRGFRVELAEIEGLLLTCRGVQAAVVGLDAGMQQLAAYVVSPDKTINREDIANLLRSKLPYYMIPSTLDIIDELPMTPSQKVDRKRLPKPETPLLFSAHKITTAPFTETEKAIVRVIAEHIGRDDISMTDHFFNDLGGHSLLAAVVTSQLRENPFFEDMSVADFYKHPILSDLAKELEGQYARKNTGRVRKEREVYKPSRLSYYTCSFFQGVALLLIAFLFGLEWLGPFFVYSYYYQSSGDLVFSLGMMLLMYCSLLPGLSVFAIIFKWLAIGRMKPGRYKLWGAYYFRFWFVDKIIHICPIVYFTGTPLMNHFLRLLGAKVGKHTYINTPAVSVYDTLDIGNHVSVCTDTHMRGYTISDGYLHIGNIRLEDDVFVGTRCNLSHNSVMERNSSIEDLTLVPEGMIVPANENRSGSPAVRTGFNGVPERRKLWRASYSLLFLVSVFIIPLVTMVAYFPGMMLITHVSYSTDGYHFLWLTIGVGVSFILLLTTIISVAKWLMLGNIKEGKYPVDSFFYYKKWFFDQLMKLSLQVIGTLYTTLYLRKWFKLLGVKMGKRVEISTVEFISPDLLVTGDECFLADSVSVGASHVRGGYITIAKAYIGNRTFVGNSAVISPGTVLKDNVLVGVLSKMANEDLPAQAGTSWFGSPAVYLPKRDVNHDFPAERTYNPSRKLFALRYSIEFFRVILPASLFILLATLIMDVISYLQIGKSIGELLLVFPLLYVGAGIVATLVTVLLKWLIVGKYRPQNKPLWSGFVWRSELVTGLFENFLVLFFMNMLTGTAFIKYPLKLLGCKIGRRTCIYTTQVTEFDLIHIGDDSVLNDNCTLQTHLFEDRVMKMSDVRIGEGCSLGGMAVVLYDSVMEDGSVLDSLSVLMKNEKLPAGSVFRGIPAKRV